MITTCPCCGKTYQTVLDRKNDKTIQDQYPNAPRWQREQLISGLCSDECWDRFLGTDSMREEGGE